MLKKYGFSAIVMLAMCLPAPIFAQTPDFGDDTSEWAKDGECDDKRFDGPGMTSTALLPEDIGHDATDCAKAFKAGQLTLRDVLTEATVVDGIDFGTDSGEYANDNECDDPRFEGEGMTETDLLETDIRADASDCLKAYQAGTLTLK